MEHANQQTYKAAQFSPTTMTYLVSDLVESDE